MNQLYKFNLVNIYNFVKTIEEKDRMNQGIELLRSCSIMWCKSVESVFSDYMNVVSELKRDNK